MFPHLPIRFFLSSVVAGLCTIGSTHAHDLSGAHHPNPGISAAPTLFTSSVRASTSTTATASALVAAPGNAALMVSSFSPFKPKVRYAWDASYFYEESDSMPDPAIMPNLMVGITSWQQQVPLPASYFAGTTNGTNDTASLGYGMPNYWRIPLVPVPSASPILISAGNFQRGAVALAANGIAVFNPRNNTGQFSYAIGELDGYGGHCGLGDDYHYHIIPVHLQSILGFDKPVAWSLDGYPIYGYTEPDGTARQTLDAEGGHTYGTWGYHYHAIGSAATGPQSPYMMSAFHGTVVNYGGQVDPQPTASGLRSSGTGGYTASPVAGAAITAFKNPVALTTDVSGHLIENVGGTALADQYFMRYTVSGTSYDLCWRLNRSVNPKTLTITWRLPGATTTTTYNNSGNRITTYPMAAASMAKLPDTGQSLDSTTTFGEDSDYTINAPAYTDNADGTITDKVTGLMWQKVDNGESTWETAVTNAGSVATGNYTDWRLPTPAELFSILNHNNGNPAAIDTTFFPSNPTGTAAYFWTSDLYGTSTTNVWCANAGGGLGPKPKTETLSAGGSFRYHARYVRGAKPSNGHNYLNNNDGTITDLDTGLMWTQAPAAALAWDAALSYAENLTLAGYSDWRLPNVKELQTLTDYTLTTATSVTGIKPSLNRTLFPSATATAYWSSTTLKSTATEAWLVEFGINAAASPQRNAQGIISNETKTSTYPAFAVRTTSVSSQIGVTRDATNLTDGVSTVSFGNVNVGASATVTFTITNNGSTSLSITGVTLDGANSGDFALITPPSSILAAGATTTASVRFTASAASSRLASLHIASSDSSVGAAFDISLSGVGYIPPPVLTNTKVGPSAPSDRDAPFITTTATPSTGATIAQVQLTYGTGAQTTGTVFTESMASAAITPWIGTNAINAWTVTTVGQANTFKQSTAANHGTGNVCGLEFDKGTVTASDSMVTTTNTINATGTAASLEFWLYASDMVSPNGWNLQLSTDAGATWTTRLSDLTGVNHAYQLYHYDLLPAERVATLKLRFQFIGYNAVAPVRAPKAYLDDITLVTTTGVAPVTLTMLDDGQHGDGAAGDGIYGVQLPAFAAGKTVSYAVTANDSAGNISTVSSSFLVASGASQQNDGLPDIWKLARGLDPASSASANGPLGDPDADRRVNLLEYALNRDPLASDADPITCGTQMDPLDSASYLAVSYPRRIGATNLTYLVQTSTDLLSWSDATASLLTTSITSNSDNATEQVSCRILPALTNPGRLFVRLRISTN